MCEPREERQPAITAHRGAVQALVDAGLEGLSLDTRSCDWSARKLAPRLRGATGRHPKDEAPPFETRCGLALNGTVTEENYEVGFNASTHFREESTDILAVRHWLAAE